MRIGRHMPTHSNMVKAAERAASLGCEAIQIFVSNPTGWRPTAENPVGSAAFKAVTEALALTPIVIHAPYLINLASPEALNWEKSVALLTWTMQRGAQIGASYVIFHTGSHRGSGVEAGIARIVQGVERVLAESPVSVMLLLENDVGAGNAVGHSFEQLAKVLRLLPSELEERVGVCLDTAHLWGAGHDIGSEESALHVLKYFDETVGLSRLKVLHLNDTEMALGSHRDVHARLGEGIIGEEGLRTILTDARLDSVIVLLETPILTDDNEKEDWEHDKTQLAKAFALANRKGAIS
ncbi:MAG: deoxyribonuclease IV [Ktedonobacteraceae bacterium]